MALQQVAATIREAEPARVKHDKVKLLGDRWENMDRKLNEEESTVAKLKDQLKAHEEAIKEGKTKMPRTQPRWMQRLQISTKQARSGRRRRPRGGATDGRGARASSGSTFGTAGAWPHTRRSKPGTEKAQGGRKGDKRRSGGEGGGGLQKVVSRSDGKPGKRGDGHHGSLKAGRVASVMLAIFVWVAVRGVHRRQRERGSDLP